MSGDGSVYRPFFFLSTFSPKNPEQRSNQSGMNPWGAPSTQEVEIRPYQQKTLRFQYFSSENWQNFEKSSLIRVGFKAVSPVLKVGGMAMLLAFHGLWGVFGLV